MKTGRIRQKASKLLKKHNIFYIYLVILIKGSLITTLIYDFLFIFRRIRRLFKGEIIKHVLYVLDNFPKVSETFILNELVNLKKRGIVVDILAAKNPNEIIINKDIYDYNLLSRLKYLPRQKENGEVSNIEEYARRYAKVDILHAHFAHRAALCALKLHKLLKTPFTCTAHAYEIFKDPYYSTNTLKLLINGANVMFTPSNYNREYIIHKIGSAGKSIRVIRATIDHNKFKVKRPIKYQDRIISIGRLVEKKGFDYLIQAMSIVLNHFPNASLYVVGSGNMESELKFLSEELSISDHVHFLGDKSNDECISLIAESVITVLPCIIAKDGDRDVCPLTLQESMSMAVPVISTTIASIPELVDDKKNGILVPEKDVTALADAIVTLLSNPSLRRRYGMNGRKKIEDEFNITTQINRQLSIWSDILRCLRSAGT